MKNIKIRRVTSFLLAMLFLSVAFACIVNMGAEISDGTGWITGKISYTGQKTGNIGVFIPEYYGPPKYFAMLSAPGAYNISLVPPGTYTVMAFMDVNPNDGEGPQPGDPGGIYDGVVVRAGEETKNIDIMLKDDFKWEFPKPEEKPPLNILVAYNTVYAPNLSDNTINMSEWSNIPVNRVMLRVGKPGEKPEPVEPLLLRIVHDANNLYFLAELNDSVPDEKDSLAIGFPIIDKKEGEEQYPDIAVLGNTPIGIAANDGFLTGMCEECYKNDTDNGGVNNVANLGFNVTYADQKWKYEFGKPLNSGDGKGYDISLKIGDIVPIFFAAKSSNPQFEYFTPDHEWMLGISGRNSPGDISNNTPPTILGMHAGPPIAYVNQNVSIDVYGYDLDVMGDANLTYSYSVTGATITGSGPKVIWKMPNTPGKYNITATVSDGIVNVSRALEIEVFPYVPGEPIERGIKWLIENQWGDGRWSDQAGLNALATLALLNHGINESNSSVAKAIQAIRKEIGENGSIHDNNYHTSMAILPLVATYNQSYSSDTAKMREWLVKLQADEGEGYNSSHWFYGGVGYGGDARPDLSNLQWALMGLYAAGLPKNHSLWEKAIIFIQRCQNLVETNDMPWANNTASPNYNDGGLVYMPSNEMEPPKPEYMMHSYGSMTGAGIWSYILAGVDVADIRVQSALNWFSKHYSWDINPEWEHRAQFYYYVTMAKALTMAGQTKIIDKNNVMHDWYAELYNTLKELQLPDGSWMNYMDSSFMEDNVALSTAYVLLALETQSLPPDVNLSVEISLASYADLHVYDPLGRHIGMNYEHKKIENFIPGAKFEVLTEGMQRVTLYMKELTSGKYNINLVGTGDGSYELEVKGYVESEVIDVHTLSGTIKKDEEQSIHTTVTSIIGPLTIFTEEPKKMPIISLPKYILISLTQGETVKTTITIREIGGEIGLKGITLYLSDLKDLAGIALAEGMLIPVFDKNKFDISKNSSVDIVLTIRADKKLLTGIYKGYLVFELPGIGSRSCPVTISVGGYVMHAIEMFADKSKDTISEQGGYATYNITVRNLGTVQDTIVLSSSGVPIDWVVNFTAMVTLLPAQSEIIVFTVKCPPNVMNNTTATIKLIATSQGNKNITAQIETLTTVILPVKPEFSISIGPISDKNNKPISGATVVIKDSTGREIARGSTNSYGWFNYTVKSIGKYTITITKHNFKEKKVELTVTEAGGTTGKMKLETLEKKPFLLPFIGLGLIIVVLFLLLIGVYIGYARKKKT